MNRSRKLIALLMVFALMFSMCSCSKTRDPGKELEVVPGSKPEHNGGGNVIMPTPSATPVPGITGNPSGPQIDDDEIIDLTMFISLAGNEKDYDNEIMNLIAEKTGVRVTETWLTGITDTEAIDILIASGKLPDFIYTNYSEDLYESNLLVACDDYLEKYPNIKALYSDEEWDNFRAPDGHIYWFDVYDRFKGKDSTTVHTGQAFWIQTRVLKWAGYPLIETLDQYFDLLERFAEANPEMPDGSNVIPYTCMCEDWRYYSIENAPMFLDGYPNDGCVIVNVDEGTDNPRVIDYNTTDTAKAYFKKLNEEYQKGIIDPDFASQTYDEYIAKLATGQVLGMCDCYWDFGYTLSDAFSVSLTDQDGKTYRLDELGCEYVPLGLVMESGTEQQWHSYGSIINYSSGLSVTTSCFDPDNAFRFLNDLLSQEIMDLRFWGIEGVDYYVDSNGLYFRTDEMRENWKNNKYKASHTCEYSYLPQWRGVSDDGLNRMKPSDQPSEFRSGLSANINECFDAYGANSYVDMIGSKYCETYPWYPLYTWSNNLSTTSDDGLAWNKMYECKHEWLPKVVISKDFDKAWDNYMRSYNACDPQVFIDAAQEEVENRMKGN